MSTAIIIASFLGGILPTVLWLEFWLRRSTHHEPRHLLIGAFAFGMASVFIAGPLEKVVNLYILEYTAISLLVWALIEELVKLLGAYCIGLRTRFCDDAMDPAIYLVTTALGFAAAENILFLFDAFADGDVSKGVTTTIFRSVGATVVHIISSGVVGVAIGWAFYKSKVAKRFALAIGLAVAIALHAAFNGFIINAGEQVLWVFVGVWVLLVVLILVLERMKASKRIIEQSQS